MSAAAALASIARALELLGRASQDWRNGTGEVPGALHWPVAVNLARRELGAALEALDGPEAVSGGHVVDLEDARAGIAWWNSLTPARRQRWLEVAGSARPADAWRAFQGGVPCSRES